LNASHKELIGFKHQEQNSIKYWEEAEKNQKET